jgi:hypothetical protein
MMELTGAMPRIISETRRAANVVHPERFLAKGKL